MLRSGSYSRLSTWAKSAQGDTSFKQITAQLLKAIGSKTEVDQYYKVYSQANHFAIIKVGGETVRDQIDDLAPALSFLHRVGCCIGQIWRLAVLFVPTAILKIMIYVFGCTKQGSK